MNKVLAIAFVFFCCILNLQSNAQTDLLSNDTSLIAPTAWSQPDTDKRELVIIDSAIISTTDTFRNLILSKYKNTSYNFADSTIKLDTRKYVNRNLIKLRKSPEHWIIYVFLFITLLFVIIRNAYAKALSVVFQAYWNDRAISQFTRDDNFIKLRNTVLYFILFASVYGVLIQVILNKMDLHLKTKPFEEYVFITLFVMAFYLAKFVLMKLSGYVFSIQKLMSGYLSVISISNFIYAIFLIPMLILHYYLPDNYAYWLFYVIMITFCFNTVYKYLRTANFIINNFQFPKFYLFLYLCTLEIMPLLIIYKVYLAQ